MYIYIMRNTTQPLKIIIENPVIEEVVSNKGASCNMASNIQNDWAIHSEKLSTENMENILAEFQSLSWEITITTETTTACNLEESIPIAWGERKFHILNDVLKERPIYTCLELGNLDIRWLKNFLTSKYFTSKYFNQQLLNFTQSFALDSDYILFEHSVMQNSQLNN